MDDYIAERLTKSTAALMEVQNGAIRPEPGTVEIRSAGTQAPPVDTKLSTSPEDYTQSPLTIKSRGRGRPQTITDMKAYKALKEKAYRAERRAKQKEGQ